MVSEENKILKSVQKRGLSPSELERVLKSVENSSPKQRQVFSDYFKKRTKIGAFSDCHIGAKEFDEPFFKYMIKTFSKNKISRAYNCGDTLEGMSGRPGHIYELSEIGFAQQFDKAKRLFKLFPNEMQVFGIDGNHDCLSMDTEVLTKRGWLTHKDIKKDDLVWSLDKDGFGNWNEISDIIIKEPNSNMFEIETQNLSLCCTGKHRILRKKRVLKKWEYTRAKELKNRVIVKCATERKHINIFEIDDNFIKFVAWILTDGTIKKDGGRKYFRIYQSKTHREIEKVLDNLGLDYTVSIRIRKTNFGLGLPQREYRISAKHKFLFDLINTKGKLPLWVYKLSKRQFEVFLDELLKGDGTVYKTKTWSAILYGKKSFLDEVQALCCMNGFRAFISVFRNNDFRLNITNKTEACFDVSKSMRQIPKHRRVWCLTVPNTNFLIRRNGKCHFTGNSWYHKKNNAGLIVGRELEDALPNYTHLGEDEANVQLRRNITMKLFHPNDGTAYAISYKMQKAMEAFTGGEKPNILLQGHYHKALYMFNRNIHGLDCGTLCGQTRWMRGKKIPAHKGFWIIDIEMGEGGIGKFSPSFYPGYK